MKKRVLHILPDVGVGGAEKLAIDLATFLDKEKYEVTIVSLFPKKENIYADIIKKRNLNVIYLNKKMGLDVNTIIKLTKIIITFKPDIVHTHRYIVVYSLLGIILSNVKVRVHTVHNIASKELPDILQKFMYICYKFFNFIPIGISETVNKTINQRYDIENNPCIYNGIDTLFFKNDKEKNKDNGGAIVNLVNVGRLTKQKNQKMLIEVFSLIRKNYNNINLTIVGDGELKNEILEQIKVLGLENNIRLTGNISDVVSELNRSDIFLLTSDYEGLPLAVIEAMSCGLPIISTKAGGIIDIVKDMENGILVDVGNKNDLKNAIEILIKDEDLRKQMALKSVELSKYYDIRQTTKLYEKIYNS